MYPVVITTQCRKLTLSPLGELTVFRKVSKTIDSDERALLGFQRR
jgi:hypothetical protein